MEPIDSADLELVVGAARPGATPPKPFKRIAIWGRTDYVAELKAGRHGVPVALPGRP